LPREIASCLQHWSTASIFACKVHRQAVDRQAFLAEWFRAIWDWRSLPKIRPRPVPAPNISHPAKVTRQRLSRPSSGRSHSHSTCDAFGSVQNLSHPSLLNVSSSPIARRSLCANCCLVLSILLTSFYSRARKYSVQKLLINFRRPAFWTSHHPGSICASRKQLSLYSPMRLPIPT
jgi:hypothetical protein